MKDKAKKTAKPNRLDHLPPYPCLEELLWAMNGMKKERMFLKSVRRDGDGNAMECFTSRGGMLYRRMLSLLRGIFTLAEVPDADALFNAIQSRFDEIASCEG